MAEGLVHTCARSPLPESITDELVERYLSSAQGRMRLVETLGRLEPEGSACPACEARIQRQAIRILDAAEGEAEPDEVVRLRTVLARRMGGFGLLGTTRLGD